MRNTSHKLVGDKINIILFLTVSHPFELAGVNETDIAGVQAEE